MDNLIIKKGQTKVIFDNGSLENCTFDVEENAALTYVFILSGGVKKTEILVRLLGKSSSSSVFGIFYGEKKDEFQIVIRTIHKASDSSGQTFVKGILDGESKCIFLGLVDIEKSASGSCDILRQDTLLLSSQSKVESLPHMEIKANNAAAKHSVTSSGLSDEQILYLQMRGIDPKTSRKLMIEGFLLEILNKLPRPKGRRYFDANLRILASSTT